MRGPRPTGPGLEPLLLILVRTVLNNFYFRQFSLLKFLFRSLFVFLQLKNSNSRETNSNNFRFYYENSSDHGVIITCRRVGTVLQCVTLWFCLWVCQSVYPQNLAPYLHLATYEMWCWSGGSGILILKKTPYSTVYYYNGAQRYKQFLQVGWLYWALILLGLALYHPSASVLSIFMVLYI